MVYFPHMVAHENHSHLGIGQHSWRIFPAGLWHKRDRGCDKYVTV